MALGLAGVQMSNFDSFLQAVSSQTAAQPGSSSFIEGKCHHVEAGGMFFTVESWDGSKHVFGPAPWPGGPEPLAGALLLVVFLGGGISRPWVTAVAGSVVEPVGGAVPISGIIPSMTATAPTDWVVLDGSTVVGGETTYPELWDLLPGSWKSGSNIVLADARGRALIGAGTGSGLTARTLGAVGGAETHVLTTGEMPAHDHDFITDSVLFHPFAAGGGSGGRVSAGQVYNSDARGADVPSAGGGGAHTNMQPWLAATPIMRCR